MAGLHGPLPTLRPWPRGQTRTARGRRGSLLLRRIGLSPTTPGRSPGALPSPGDQNLWAQSLRPMDMTCLKPVKPKRVTPSGTWYKRSRLWRADGSCVRLRPESPNHVWSYDFVEDRTHDGRKFRMLNVVDEFTHECLAIRVDRKLKAIDVIDVLADLFIL